MISGSCLVTQLPGELNGLAVVGFEGLIHHGTVELEDLQADQKTLDNPERIEGFCMDMAFFVWFHVKFLGRTVQVDVYVPDGTSISQTRNSKQH